MKQLHLYETGTVNQLMWPTSYEFIHLHSPATAVFTDFVRHRPSLIGHRASAVEAEQQMRSEHIKLKMVVDDASHFLGVISLDDLDSQEMLKLVASGYHQAELLVGDFMRPKGTLRSIALHELEQATIEDVVTALRECHQQHCLVLDHDQALIRGMISASDIARKIRLPIDIQKRSSFVNIFNAVYG